LIDRSQNQVTFVHFCTFAARVKWNVANFAVEQSGGLIVAYNRIHARQAALALLKMAKTTSDPKVAAVEAEADLNDQAGELPPSVVMAKGAIDARQKGN
jgi:hypothetical protein